MRATGIADGTSIDTVRDAVAKLGPLGPIVFVLLYIMATVLFLPASPLSILAGTLFGLGFGTLLVVIGATIGATIAFFIARLLGESTVSRWIKHSFPKIDTYNERLAANGFHAVAFLRLVPLFPFNGLNFALGLTKVKPREYILGTLIGIIPGTFAFVYLGASLAALNPVHIALAITAFIAILLIGPIYNKYGAKHK